VVPVRRRRRGALLIPVHILVNLLVGLGILTPETLGYGGMSGLVANPIVKLYLLALSCSTVLPRRSPRSWLHPRHGAVRRSRDWVYLLWGGDRRERVGVGCASERTVTALIAARCSPA
jgi:hypothetical protein